MIDYFYFLCIDERDSPNLQELRKLSKDELSRHPYHRHFGICGVIFDTITYPEISLKLKNVQKKYIEELIPFHYVDMLNNKGKFSFLGDDLKKRQGLFDCLNSLLSRTDYKVIASFIDKHELALKYGIESKGKLHYIKKIRGNLYPKTKLRNFNLYYLTLRFIIRDFCRFLGNKKAKGAIIAEARGKREDELLLKHFYDIQKFGAAGLTGPEVRAYISDLLIIDKHQNHIGLQIADLITYPTYDKIVPNHSVRNDHFIDFMKCIDRKIYRGTVSKGISIFP